MIIIIDNYDSFTYNLYQYVAQSDVEIQVHRNDQISLEQIAELEPQGIILSPGPGRPENAGICVDLVKRFGAYIPILGVCLGHQAIAIANNAKVIPAKNIMHGKTSLVFHNRGQLYKKLGLPFHAGRYHSLTVAAESINSDLIVEAQTEDDVIMGIKHRDYPCYGVQFHPESILSESGMQLIDNFLEVCQELQPC